MKVWSRKISVIIFLIWISMQSIICQTWSAEIDFYGMKQEIFYNNSLLKQPTYYSNQEFYQ